MGQRHMRSFTVTTVAKRPSSKLKGFSASGSGNDISVYGTRGAEDSRRVAALDGFRQAAETEAVKLAQHGVTRDVAQRAGHLTGGQAVLPEGFEVFDTIVGPI